MKENVYYSVFYSEIPECGTVNLEVNQDLSSFELDLSSFELDLSSFELDLSSFELDLSSFELDLSSFELGRLRIRFCC